MNIKTCTKCKTEKKLNDFGVDKASKDGFLSQCKLCRQKYRLENKKYYAEYHKEYNIKNVDKVKEYRTNNKEKQRLYQLEYQKKYYLDKKDIKQTYVNNNKEKIKEYQKLYRETNKENIKLTKNNYRNNRRKIDPLYKLTNNIRTSIYISLSRNGFTKKSKTFQILGCTFEEFKSYLETKWESWMNWDNYGLYNGKSNYGWDVDHIKPLNIAKTEEDIIKLNHFTNLQPLCSYINRDVKKGY